MSLYVYIGRFQIPHFGHESVMKHAIDCGDKVLILIGSANTARSLKNPFTFNERKEMVGEIVSRIKQETGKDIDVSILPLNDFATDNEWVEEVKSIVSKEDNVFITGCRKSGDESTFYLNLFPEWKQDFISEVNVEGMDVISSTKIRNIFFSGDVMPDVISRTTQRFLDKFKNEKHDVFSMIKNQG